MTSSPNLQEQHPRWHTAPCDPLTRGWTCGGRQQVLLASCPEARGVGPQVVSQSQGDQPSLAPLKGHPTNPSRFLRMLPGCRWPSKTAGRPPPGVRQAGDAQQAPSPQSRSTSPRAWSPRLSLGCLATVSPNNPTFGIQQNPQNSSDLHRSCRHAGQQGGSGAETQALPPSG